MRFDFHLTFEKTKMVAILMVTFLHPRGIVAEVMLVVKDDVPRYEV